MIPDKGVDFDNFDLVELLDGRLYLVLVALHINIEDQGVVVLNLLHSRLFGETVFDNIVSVQVGGKTSGTMNERQMA